MAERAAGAEGAAEGVDEGLDPGWEEVEAEDGRVYYWNEDTDSTTWEKPTSRRGSMDTSTRSGTAVRCSASEPEGAAEGVDEGRPIGPPDEGPPISPPDETEGGRRSPSKRVGAVGLLRKLSLEPHQQDRLSLRKSRSKGEAKEQKLQKQG